MLLGAAVDSAAGDTKACGALGDVLGIEAAAARAAAAGALGRVHVFSPLSACIQ